MISVKDPHTFVNETAADLLLASNENRYVMFPIKDGDIWAMYKKQIDCFWRAEEIDFSKDLTDWGKLTEDEKYFISMVLGFFAASDGIIVENLAQRFMSDVQLAEARAFYGFQIAMENIHSETYSIMIDTFIKEKDQQMRMFESVQNFPCIAKKANWAKKWITDNRSSFAARLVAFAVVEGIFFSSSFAAIYWIKKHKMIREAVRWEKEFITEAIPCRLIGMNMNLMKQYIEFVADRMLLQLGYDKVYHSCNPFDFMELISIESKTNFFERTNSEYALANKTVDKNIDDIFEFGVDF